MEQNTLVQSDIRAGRKVFSRIGFSFFVLTLLTIVVAQILGEVVSAYAPWMLDEAWYSWAFNLLPLYLFAFPVFWLIIRKAPSSKIKPYRMSPSRFVLTAIMCVPLLYIGNIVSVILSLFLFNGLESATPVEEIIMGSDAILNFISAVIIAPIGEEFIFRRLLIDKTVRYGEGIAVLISATFFALFHGNFYQVFYAFLLGLMFGYIYVKTGKLRYTIVLHMIINFLGAIIAPALLLLDNSSSEGVLLSGLFVTIIFGLAITGFVLLIVNRKRFILCPGEYMLSKGKKLSMAALNAGTIVFLFICLRTFILTTISFSLQ